MLQYCHIFVRKRQCDNMEIINFDGLAQLWYENYTMGNCYSYNIQLKSLIKHMSNFFGNTAIKEIKPMDITNMINSLSICNPNTNKPMSKQTLRVLLTTAYRIFDMAVDNDLLIKNPAKNVKIPKNAPRKKIRGISKEEQFLILNTPHRCRTAALVMMLMGLRTGEMLALQWKI